MNKIFLLLLLLPVLANADLVDLDQDGRNDILFADKTSNGINYGAYLSSSFFSRAVTVATNFGAKKQTPIAASWDNNDFEPATVVVNRKGKVILRVDGRDNLRLGSRKVGVLAGFDLKPASNSADIMTYNRRGKVTIYQDQLNFVDLLKFRSREVRKAVPVALSGDDRANSMIGFVRATGKKRRKQYRLVAQDTLGNRISSKLGRYSGRLRNAFNYKLNTETGRDGILLVLKRGNRTIFKLVNRNGRLISSFTTSRIKNIAVANYAGNNGDEALIRVGRNYRIINVIDGISVDVPLASDFLDEDYFKRPSTNDSSDDSPNSSVGAPSGGLGSVCSSVRGVPGGVLWKPDSDVSDNRGGKPVILYQGGNKPRQGSVDIYASNGAKICNFTFKSPNSAGINGNSDHFYSGWTGGCSRSGGEIAALARAASGNTNVYFEGPGSSCFGPANPDARNGAIF